MIFYDYALCEQARQDRDDLISSHTGREFTYTYYIELVQQHRNRTLANEDYYDFEVCQFKYDQNRN